MWRRASGGDVLENTGWLMGEWKLGAMMLGNQREWKTIGRDPGCPHIAQQLS